MRRSPMLLIMALTALVGCASTVGGTAAVDPNAALTTASTTRTLQTGATSTTPVTPQTSSTTEPSTTSSSSSSSSTSSSSSSTTSTTSSTTDETSETVPIPDGFKHWDSDIAYRAMDPASEFSCGDGQDVCFGLELFSAAGCDAGITVDLNVYATSDESAEPIGQSSGTSPAVPAGGTAQVIVGFSSDQAAEAADPSADLIDIRCG